MQLFPHRHHARSRMKKTLVVFWCMAALGVTPVGATELKGETAAAFDRYIRATEARMDDDVTEDEFLVVDRLPESRRQEAYAQLQDGQVYIEELHTREDHHSIHVPGGLIHHWAGVIFIPRATLSQTIAVLQDYNHHQMIYQPDVRQSKLIEENGNGFKIYLQFFSKSVVTVVLNVDFDVSDTPFGSTRYQIVSRSTRIAEVANFGKPDEHELPVGNNHGYMWSLYTYWRLEEKDGGVYLQNESVALSRAVPFMLAWLVNPLVKNIPRNVITNLLANTRKAVLSPGSRSDKPNAIVTQRR